MPEKEKLDKTPETLAPESGEAKPDGSPATATTVSETPETKPRTDHSGVIGGLFIWLLIFGGVAYWFFPHNCAQVFLEASREPPGQLNGIVLFKGAPVSKGTVYLFFEDPRTDQYLASAILRVTESGEFVTSANESSVFKDSNEEPKPLRVTATFTGQQQEQKKEQQEQRKDKAPIPVTGKAILYLNYPAPAGKLKIWSLAIMSTAFSIALITLFVGELTRRRARILFWITYLMSFLSLAVPIWGVVAVSKSDPVVDIMLKAPIGLIKGTARGVQRPQWLVNVGGAVIPAPKEVPTKKAPVSLPAKELPTKEGAMGRPSPVEARIPVSPSPTPTATPASTPTPTPLENMGTDEPRQIPGFALVLGGLAVPFYVIILAMLGAGINMIKKVPDIQKLYDTDVPSGAGMESIAGKALAAPWKVLAAFSRTLWNILLSRQSRIETPWKALAAPVVRPSEEVIQVNAETEKKRLETMSTIRRALIDIYMGLISAPFLAIAVYYLLQVIATNVAEPVLVVVSFATGFISDSIVAAITKVGSDLLKQASGGPLEGKNEGAPTGKKEGTPTGEKEGTPTDAAGES